MAVGQFLAYNSALFYLMRANVDLETSAFDLHLFTSASNASVQTLSVLSQLTNEVASGNGYKLSGKSLTAVWEPDSTSVDAMRFSAANVVFSAASAAIANIRWAVVVAHASALANGTDVKNKIIARSPLSTTQFSINSGSTLTVTLDPIFILR